MSIKAVYTKLSKRYYGLFLVEERIGPVAYRLQLPTNSKIHPVFYVSLLKLHQGPFPDIPDSLPPLSSDNHPIVKPLQILDSKWDSSTNPPSKLVLVQWTDLAPEDTSWEQWDNLCVTYNLGDKVSFEDGGDDSNNNSLVTTNRPRRTTRRPTHLSDYP
ncbi:hypothetical protein HKD37_07G020120 [Glycine soja]